MNLKLKGLTEEQLQAAMVVGGMAFKCGSQGTGECKIENGTQCDGGLIYDLKPRYAEKVPLHVLV